MRGLLLVVGLALVGCDKVERPGAAPSSADKPAARKAASTARIAAGALWLDYGENQIKADDSFKGKTITVHGQVRSVFDYDDAYAVGFLVYLDEDTALPAGTIAKFSASRKGDLANLKPYEEVEITGVCRGKVKGAGGRRGYIVLLEDCTLDAHKKRK